MACNKFKFIMSSYAQAPQEEISGKHILAGGSITLARKGTQVKSILSQSPTSMLLENPKVQS